MLIRFQPNDKVVLLAALDLLEKAAEKAVKAYEHIGLPSMGAQALKGGADLCVQRVKMFCQDGELSGHHELEGELIPALRTALYLLGMEVEKQKEKAIERTIDPHDFDVRLAHLEDLRKRTSDQQEIPWSEGVESVTISTGDASVTMTPDQFARVADALGAGKARARRRREEEKPTLPVAHDDAVATMDASLAAMKADPPQEAGIEADAEPAAP